MVQRIILLLCMGLLLAPGYSWAQADSTSRHAKRDKTVYITERQQKQEVFTTDSAIRKKHSPKIAIALSAVIPGAGQVYNKRWWKVPIVYGALAVSGGLVYYFSREMVGYRNEYRYRMTGETEKLDPRFSEYNDESVLSLKQEFTRYMEISVAATGIIYMLNIIDAAVDAHLYYFDISEDLAFRVAPTFRTIGPYAAPYAGVSFTLKWK
ncbi:MAG: hypothetical protein J5642_03620 [Bacteroidales bacterium]|nr:hypothetical protein [Bacteroidales bacterium]